MPYRNGMALFLCKNLHICLNLFIFAIYLVNRLMKLRKLYILVICLSAAVAAFAVPASPQWFDYVQPDGSKVMVQLVGDENGAWYKSADGQFMLRGEDGFLYEVSSEMVQQRRRQAAVRRLPAEVELAGGQYVPRRGTVRIPVVLVNYTDLSFTISDPVEKFHRLFNTDGGTNPRSTGSVHSYYDASSHGQLNLVYDVYGPYEMSRNRSYYGGNNGDDNDKNIRALVREAAAALDAAGIDLTQYDNNNDGALDNLSIITPGCNEAEGGPADAIWPHYNSYYSSPTVGGVTIGSYLVISEYRGSSGNVQAGIGTYCHEFGHALGLPDLYNTESSSAYTVGTWDIMCSGSYNNNGCTPPEFSAFERFMMGWLQPEQLSLSGNYMLEPLETSNKAYLIAAEMFNGSAFAPSPNEYFLIENRQDVGWDANTGALAGTGLLISHVTFNNTYWDYNMFNNKRPLGYAIVSAANSVQTQTTAADLFPGTARIPQWTPTLNDGTLLASQKVLSIMEGVDNMISFHYGEATGEGFHFEPESLPLLTTTYDNARIDYDTVRVTLVGKKIASQTLDVYFSNSNFMFSPDEGATWFYNQNHFVDNVSADSTYSRELLVCYRPTRQGCTPLTSSLVVMSADKRDMAQIMVSGVAPRPVYITTPDSLFATDIASTSFSVNWKEVEDADAYFMTMYSRANVPSETTQTFEDFTSRENIFLQGWTSNFVRQFTQTKLDGKYSIQFLNEGEFIQSELYPSPVSSLHFWVSNNYSQTTDTPPSGDFVLEGSTDGRAWQLIDRFTVKRTTKGLTKEYEFSENEEYVQFRMTYYPGDCKGGAIIDAFSANMPTTITYICRGLEHEIPAPGSRAIFTDLTPGTTYYWQVRSFEEKGCEAHYSDLSEPQLVVTSNPNHKRQELMIIRSEDGVYTLQMLQPAAGTTYVNIYTPSGELVVREMVPYGTSKVILPTDNLQKHQIYFVKIVEGRMSRQADYGKMLYY